MSGVDRLACEKVFVGAKEGALERFLVILLLIRLLLDEALVHVLCGELGDGAAWWGVSG